MEQKYIKEDGHGNYFVTDDDTGMLGRCLGQKVEDMPGGAFIIKDEKNNNAYLAAPTADGQIMVIISDRVVVREESEN